MIFALAPASNFSSLTVKIVFSFGFSTSSAASAGAAAPPAGAAEGIATSVMFNFVFNADTSSETSSRDRVEICSTRGAILGDRGSSLDSARWRDEEAKDRYRGVGCILSLQLYLPIEPDDIPRYRGGALGSS